jgi:phosphomannomutase
MKGFICSLSGIRGIVGGGTPRIIYRGLTPATAYRAASVFFDTYLVKGVKKGKILKVIVGMDPKDSGRELLAGVAAGLSGAALKSGVRVELVNLGITSTPAVEWAVSKYSALGGVMVTASHNPLEWNGLKFISGGKNERPTLLPPVFMAKINRALEARPPCFAGQLSQNFKERPPAPAGVGFNIVLPEVKDYTGDYFADVLKKVAGIIDECSGKRGVGTGIMRSIGRRKYKVVVDACCGAGAALTTGLLRAFGVKAPFLAIINKGKIERSERPLEPAVENLGNLRRAVEKRRADAGFAVDPDQDRLVAVPLSTEENTPLIAAKFLLELQKMSGRKRIKEIVINSSTSAAWEDVAAGYGVRIIRVPVGEVNVALEMIRRGAVLGAEGNGGIILGSVNYGRNSAVGIALIMCYLAWSGKTLAEIESELPRYYITKQKIPSGGMVPAEAARAIVRRFKSDPRALRVETYDGVKVSFRDGSWLHVRASNTEPIIRIFAETRDAGSLRLNREKADGMVSSVKKILNSGG